MADRELLRSPAFDGALIGGPWLLGLGFGLAALARPDLFLPLLLVDVWLLGYHHVIATWTRLALDPGGFARHRFLALGALPGVLLAVAALVWLGGSAAVATLYLHWQWWHYTRQSHGLEALYRRRGGGPAATDRLTASVLYGFPLWGLLERSAQRPPQLLGMDLWLLPVAPDLAHALGLAVVAAGAVWLVRTVGEARRGALRPGHTFYVLSHATIFTLGYVAIRDVDHGWLALNVWHNAQYLLVVWHFHNRRFAGDPSARPRWAAALCAPRRAPLYVALCLLLTAALYLPLREAAARLAVPGLPMAVVLYQAFNFHHYLADARLWKLRQRPVARVFGLAQT